MPVSKDRRIHPEWVLHYDADEFPDPEEWWRARREWVGKRARSMDDINALYDITKCTFPPDDDDPRLASWTS